MRLNATNPELIGVRMNYIGFYYMRKANANIDFTAKTTINNDKKIGAMLAISTEF